ncbi:MAG TPA: NRDE family protein [Vicinamibacterales bacterium]
MCTVSAAYSADGSALRILINRDERRLRAAARPPEIFESGGVSAAWPVDQEAGGTWAAVSSRGLAFALLNASGRPARTTTSRGAIIPHLVASSDINDVIGRFAAGPARWSCGRFKLLVPSLERSVVLTNDGVADLAMPAVLATSSLGDDLVAGPRLALFQGLLASSTTSWEAQDRLHRHAWPDRRHLSVLMSRPDASTVSRTEIVLMPDRSVLRYTTILDGWPAGVAAGPIQLARRRAAVAA